MGVVIDKSTFEKYQKCDDPVLKTLIQLKVLPNPKSTNDASFAKVATNGPDCPFLQQDKDCAIQVTLGEDYLSRTCDTYPRAFSKVDNTLERSLYLSCPEAARIILLRSSEIRFSAPGEGREEKYDDFPSVDTNDELYGGKPYKHFGLIRNFVVHLLRNRKYLVWQRMVILGMYCDQLARIPIDDLDVGAPRLTESFGQHINNRGFDSTLSGIAPNYALMLNVVISSLEDRIHGDYTSPRFLECYRMFIDGIGHSSGIETETLAQQFSAAQTDWYAPFFDNKEYIWENFLVAKAYKDLFPFGPQHSLYQESRSVYQEYILLTMQYVFARTVLVGYSGSAKSDLTLNDVVKVVQSFSRAVEHNPPYMTKIVRSLESGNIAPLPVFATLIRP
jgi:lysine-N-methylase